MTRLLFTLLLALLAAPAQAEERRLFDASAYGAVVGPLDHELTEDEEKELLAQFDRFSEAKTALGERRWDDAARGFEDVLETTGWFEAAYNGALARRAQGRVVEATTLAERSVAIRPGDHAAVALQAGLLQTRGRHADALLVLDVALETARAQGLAFEEALVLLNRGSALAQLGRSDEATEAFQRAGELGSQSGRSAVRAAAKLGEGRAAATRGDVAAAKAAFDAAATLSTDQDVAELRVALAGTLAEAGDTAGAEAMLAQAAGSLAGIEDALRRGTARVDAAGLARDLGDLDSARAWLGAAENDLSPHRDLPAWSTLLVHRGRLQLRDGDPDAAAVTLQEATVRLEQTQAPLALADARVSLAQAHVERRAWGDADIALRAADQTLSAGGAEGPRRRLVVVRSELHRRQGKLAEALEDIETAITLADRGGDVRSRTRLRAERAVILAARGDVDAAAREAQKIAPAAYAELDGRTRARVDLRIAFAASAAGRPDDAEKRARRAASIMDAGPEIRDAACKLVVQILLDSDRRAEAETFVAEQGMTGDAIESVLTARRDLDRYNEGVDAYNSGDHAAAADIFRALADGPDDGNARRVQAAENLVSSLLLVAGSHRRAGRTDDAVAAYTEAAERGPEIGKHDSAARALLGLSELRTEAGDPRGAVTHAARAAEAAFSADDDELQGRAFMALGDAWYELDEAESANAYRRALTAWGDTETTAADAAIVSFNLAGLLANSDRREAVRLLERAAALAAAAGDGGLARDARDAIATLTAE